MGAELEKTFLKTCVMSSSMDHPSSSSSTSTENFISSPPRSPSVERASKRRSVFFNKPKNFTLFTDVTNTSPKNSPVKSTPTKKNTEPTTPKSMGKISKKQLSQQLTTLENELKLVKFKAAMLQEQNEKLKVELEEEKNKNEAPAQPLIAEATTTRIELLEEENKRLQKELDGYITKKWRDFCAVQSSPTPTRKRAWFND